MIDYIKAAKLLDSKDKPFLGHCSLEASYSSGWEKYYLKGCEKICVWYAPAYNTIRLEGSILYYRQGHNFYSSRSDFAAALKHIIKILNVNLWDATIEVFEYGKIMEVDGKPKEYIAHHTPAPKEGLTMNEKPKDKGGFKWFEGKNVKLKMYDAGKNIQQKLGSKRKEILESSGWKPNGQYLKWEAHYLQPNILNNSQKIILADLLNPNWESIFKEDLYLQYKRLIPMRSLLTPTKKSELSTADLLVTEIVECHINDGKTIEEVKKILYNRINSIDDKILSKADKDSRKRQIKILLGKIQEEPESKWDISKELEKALCE